MSLHDLLGASLLTRILFFLALVLVIGIWVAEFLTIFYHRFWYPKVLKPKFDATRTPRCAIIVPCKGTPALLRESIHSYLEMDYPDFEVVYSVESESDPAVPVIREAIAGRSRARLVVAGYASECCQKNHNLLKGIEVANDPEIYVFADADIRPEKNWLRELTLPFSDQKVTATSGFRWMYPGSKPTIGEYDHIYFNNFLYVLFSTGSFIVNAGLWGGAMAIRRSDFENLRVGERWAHTAVDDISLAEIIMKNGRKSFIIPPCITSTDDALPTVKKSTLWIERQMMFLKMYHTPMWLISAPMVLATIFLILWTPAALLISRFDLKQFLAIGGGASLVFAVGDFLASFAYPLLGKTRHLFRFCATQPLLRLLQMIALARTIFTNTITWSGVKYRVKLSNGKVRSLDRGATKVKEQSA